jgi:HAD superfamily phosphatase (TIGR01681 family)
MTIPTSPEPSSNPASNSNPRREKKVKCLVWDLDNTLWNGVLLEHDQVSLRDGVIDIIQTLDRRGILQSIASKNEYDPAMAKLQAFGLAEYFLYPQINQAFEREEVSFSQPKVLCIDAADLDTVLTMPVMNPQFITEDSAKRRQMYLSDMTRTQEEESFVGPKEEFLATLNMVFTLGRAKEEDLKRAEELTVRTNQLNTTGYTYSYEELDQLRHSNQHLLLIAGLDDKYGTYGKIGLMLIECGNEIWTIKLLLMSCRVMSRGVGTVMINHIRNEARNKGVRLRAEFIPNDRNRMMYMTYKFNHFKEVEKVNDLVILENDLSLIQPFPGYLTVNIG